MGARGDLDPFGADAPFWRRHYGIGRPWSPRPGARRGCMLMLYAAFIVLVLTVGIAAVAALLS